MKKKWLLLVVFTLLLVLSACDGDDPDTSKAYHQPVITQQV